MPALEFNWLLDNLDVEILVQSNQCNLSLIQI